MNASGNGDSNFPSFKKVSVSTVQRLQRNKSFLRVGKGDGAAPLIYSGVYN